MICPRCGKTFERRATEGRIPVYCSEKCRKTEETKRRRQRHLALGIKRKSSLNRRRKDKPRKPQIVKTCLNCGKEFSTAWVRRYCCSARCGSRIKNKARRRAKCLEAQALIAKAKDVPCSDCGRRFPKVAMDFDHRPGLKKEFTVSAMSSGSWSTVRVQAEIDKCEVVCANCHRIRTFARGAWGRVKTP